METVTVIGITGPTGSGKTTALQVLAGLGFAVIDCDALYYQLLGSDEGLRRQLMEAFGNIFLPDGQLDRKTLGKLVFGDAKAMGELNAIVFPAIGEAVEAQIAACTGRGVVVDAINLLESGLGERCDWTFAITAPVEHRVKRIMARDNISEAYARSRVAAQKSDSFYRKHCTMVLENRAGSKAEFEQLIRTFFEDFLADMEDM